jgi:prepilin-type processing-associated H-X9-DG protein/prepilin-type N-terminal cleavage/methylation domain-containing protein
MSCTVLRRLPQQRRRQRNRGAFTLVELLVVIGIIAVLIGILLPVISAARQRAETTACMATLRNLGQAIYAYSVEFKGSVPFSLYYESGTSSAGQTAVGESEQDVKDKSTYVWWAVLRKYMRGHGGNWDNSTFNSDGSRSTRFMAAFACASGQNRDAGCDYGANMLIMPELNWENLVMTNTPSPNKLARPGQLGRMYPDCALLWDQSELAPGFDKQFVCGYGVDGGLFSDSTNYPWYRIRGVAPSDDPDSSDDHPIRPGPNVDINTSNFTPADALGNIRWRHNKNKVANFLFADGSVKSFTITTNYDDPASTKGDCLRKYFRIKPPTGYLISP